MAGFGAAGSLRTLMSDLLDLVDEHTAYFKGHLESLPAQERRVYLALLALWKPATAREVAEQARMEASKCSAQLGRLIGRGVVEEAGGTSRRKQYYVSERLYNIYYLLRRSRGADSLVGGLVEFMDAYYSPAELTGMVDEMAGEVGTVDSQTRLIYQVALERLRRLPVLAWHFFRQHPGSIPDEDKELTQEAAALLHRGGASFDRGDSTAALEALNDLVSRFGRVEVPTVRDSIAKALVNRGVILARLERHQAAIRAFEQAAEEFGSTRSPEIEVVLATAMVGRSVSLEALGRTGDAIAALEGLEKRFESARSLSVEEAVATGMFNRGNMLGKMGRTDEELEAYDALLGRFGANESALVLGPVADGQVSKAISLFNLVSCHT